MSLEGKCIVVTGSTRGIGKVTATHLAELGAHVAVVGRNRVRGEKLTAEIAATGGTARFFQRDLTQEEEVASLFGGVQQTFGPVDVVVNNAAATDVASRDRPVTEQPTADFDHFIRSNLHTVFWCFKYGIPRMPPEGGSFVTISSIEAITPRPGEPSYATTKAAICGLARQVAVDYGHKGIRSNTLQLGFIETNASRPLLDNPTIGRIVRSVTGGHPPRSLDVARAVAFLASESASGFNGATLTLDRGMTITGHLPGDL
jgi:NAD(P)-dependent dehydrogenase (short-subunit alcohol dehydrogenase family)